MRQLVTYGTRFALCSGVFALALLSLVFWEQALQEKPLERLQFNLAQHVKGANSQEALEDALSRASNALQKGQFALQLGHVETAEVHLRQGLALKPANPFSWHQLALVQDNLGQSPGAVLASFQASLATGNDVPALIYPRLRLAAKYADALDDNTTLKVRVYYLLQNRWDTEALRLVSRLNFPAGRQLLLKWGAENSQMEGVPNILSLHEQFMHLRAL